MATGKTRRGTKEGEKKAKTTQKQINKTMWLLLIENFKLLFSERQTNETTKKDIMATTESCI